MKRLCGMQCPEYRNVIGKHKFGKYNTVGFYSFTFDFGCIVLFLLDYHGIA